MAAVLSVRRDLPALQVLCAGGGPLERTLKALAESASLSGQFRFLGHREDLPTLLAASDVICLPSTVEGMPLALLEAASAGRPVVATAVDGVPEIVDDGSTGLLVAPRDAEGLSTALIRLLTDADEQARFGRLAREKALARFRDVDMVRRLESAYETWLAEHRLPPPVQVIE
jgi:glycosyltransferase involved in cell wall biosynthesis